MTRQEQGPASQEQARGWSRAVRCTDSETKGRERQSQTEQRADGSDGERQREGNTEAGETGREVKRDRETQRDGEGRDNKRDYNSFPSVLTCHHPCQFFILVIAKTSFITGLECDSDQSPPSLPLTSWNPESFTQI